MTRPSFCPNCHSPQVTAVLPYGVDHWLVTCEDCKGLWKVPLSLLRVRGEPVAPSGEGIHGKPAPPESAQSHRQWNSKGAWVTMEKKESITCSICKKVFIPIPRNKRYCSQACRKAAVKEQKRRHYRGRYERSRPIKYPEPEIVITVQDIKFITVPHGYGEYVRQPDFGIGF